MTENIQRICITGGPGSGKTSLINHLQKSGYDILPEVSREIILEAQAGGVEQPFLNDPIGFSKELMQKRIQQFQDAEGEMTFFDRGIPDVIAYHHYQDTDYPDTFAEAAKKYNYDAVFILPPWKEIYRQDNERYESFEQAVAIHENLLETYTQFGYRPIEVRFGELSTRMNQIISSLVET